MRVEKSGLTWERYRVCISQENGTQARKYSGKKLKRGTSYEGIGRAETNIEQNNTVCGVGPAVINITKLLPP